MHRFTNVTMAALSCAVGLGWMNGSAVAEDLAATRTVGGADLGGASRVIAPLGPPLGACCLADSTCVENLTEELCTAMSGTFAGDGTQCADVMCKGAPDPIELVFTIDGSGSISTSEFNLQIEGIAGAIENATVVPTDGTVSFGLVQFSNGAVIEIPLTLIDSPATAQSLADQIRLVSQLGGGTSIAAGISTALAAHGANLPDVRDVICLTTDGVSTAAPALDAAQAAMDAGIDEIDAIGVGDGINEALLQQIADIGMGAFVTVADFEEFEQVIAAKIQQVIANTGACCFPAGQGCAVITEDECVAAGGVFSFGLPCELACGGTGACCLEWTCLETTEDECLANDGLFMGPDTECAAVCCEVVIDFELEDDGAAPLTNGQAITADDENGTYYTVEGAGYNDGAAIFDTDSTGPNADAPDQDLLVDSGLALILQANNSELCDPDHFCVPNDSAYGGTLLISFLAAVSPRSIDLIDICPGDQQDALVEVNDIFGNSRWYHVPAGWTVDGGVGTLNLDTLDAQPGVSTVATATEDDGFDNFLVASIRIMLEGSGAVDNVTICPVGVVAGPGR